MHRLAFAAAALASLVVFGCSSERLTDAQRTGEANEDIIDGTLDTTHQAVVALFGSQSECTATVVAVSGGYGYALTAAHCVTLDTPQYVVQGNDYNSSSSLVYPVVSYKAHPSYNQQVYDFGMIKFSGASSSMPVIPAMQPAEDSLHLGSVVDIVGYGLTASGPTTHRYQVNVTLDQGVSSLLLEYSQTNGGPCSGDSGGPAISLVNGAERVSGVTSYGDQNCTQFGASGRVSAVYSSFIQPFIQGTAINPTQTCDQCSQVATSGSGGCVDSVDACLNNADCSALAQCFNGCSTNSCYQTCSNQHLQGLAMYDAIVACVCTDACATECAGQPFCSSSSSSTSSGATSGDATSTTSGAGGSADGSTGDVGGSTSSGTTTKKNRNSATNAEDSGCAVKSPGASDAGASEALLALLLGLGLCRRRRVTSA